MKNVSMPLIICLIEVDLEDVQITVLNLNLIVVNGPVQYVK
jgi:hypothetical protein